jgi:addiction module HigA family antidote
MALPGYALHPLKGDLSASVRFPFRATGGLFFGSHTAGRTMWSWSITISRRDAMRMKNPPHPGLSVRHDCFDPLGLSVAEGAKALGVTRQAMNNLVKGKAGISVEMAIRLEKAFGGGAETWLRMQATYDLAQMEKKAGKIKVKRVAESPVPV